MLTFKTLGITKMAIILRIYYPMRSKHIIFFYYIKNNVFSSLILTIEIMKKIIVKGKTNMNSMNA
jgi:hypothetical protein